jgi:hypothetical protein
VRIVEKDDQIQQLMGQVIELRAKTTAQATVKPPRGVDSKQITEAIQAVFPSVQFCLDDIDSRVNTTEGAPRSRDIDAVVRLSTTPSGKPFDVRASGIDYSPSVRLCIEDALKRVDYPKGSETVEVRVDIAWTAGNLTMSARVIGTREPGMTPAVDM